MMKIVTQEPFCNGSLWTYSFKGGVTAGGKLPTFEASRSEETSHADIAWATMHALLHEPLAGATGANTSMMEIFA